MEDQRNAQTAVSDRFFLQGAVQCGSVGLEQCTDLSLTDQCPDCRIAGGIIGNQVQFGNLFLQGHPPEQVMDTHFHRFVPVLIVRYILRKKTAGQT